MCPIALPGVQPLWQSLPRHHRMGINMNPKLLGFGPRMHFGWSANFEREDRKVQVLCTFLKVHIFHWDRENALIGLIRPHNRHRIAFNLHKHQHFKRPEHFSVISIKVHS